MQHMRRKRCICITASNVVIFLILLRLQGSRTSCLRKARYLLLPFLDTSFWGQGFV